MVHDKLSACLYSQEETLSIGSFSDGHMYAGSNESQQSRITVDAIVSKKKLWRGKYCCVPQCCNSSGGNVVQNKLKIPKIFFHSFPDVKSAKGKQWVKLIHCDPGSDFIVNKNTRICSDHFSSTDFFLLQKVKDGV